MQVHGLSSKLEGHSLLPSCFQAYAGKGVPIQNHDCSIVLYHLLGYPIPHVLEVTIWLYVVGPSLQMLGLAYTCILHRD